VARRSLYSETSIPRDSHSPLRSGKDSSSITGRTGYNCQDMCLSTDTTWVSKGSLHVVR
jgi:hypothetical protein